ncbi:hypothetical protein GCM10010448_45320 [Streptomyces glomeratus]|uniref:Uncharacterized protein n=1 Tax=Streptomyces glomeratus TaxID=284452 RepID=A0ABP6LUR5_9ACTN
MFRRTPGRIRRLLRNVSGMRASLRTFWFMPDTPVRRTDGPGGAFVRRGDGAGGVEYGAAACGGVGRVSRVRQVRWVRRGAVGSDGSGGSGGVRWVRQVRRVRPGPGGTGHDHPAPMY